LAKKVTIEVSLFGECSSEKSQITGEIHKFKLKHGLWYLRVKIVQEHYSGEHQLKPGPNLIKLLGAYLGA